MGKCICKESATKSKAGECIARAACARIILKSIPNRDYYIERCADSLTCPDGYALEIDGKH